MKGIKIDYPGNCHNQNRDGSKQLEKMRFLYHELLMVLCCAIMLLLLFALLFFNIRSPILFMGVFLICPLMHVVMMFLMNRNKEKDGIVKQAANEQLNIKESKKDKLMGG